MTELIELYHFIRWRIYCHRAWRQGMAAMDYREYVDWPARRKA